MDDEEVDGDGGGADGRSDGVDDGGVERAGVEEKAELREVGGGQEEARRAEQEDDGKRNGEDGTPRGEEIEGAMVAPEPSLGEPASGDGGKEAVDGGDFAGGEAGAGDGVSGEPAQEGGEPGGDAADGEGPHSHAEGGGPVGGVFEKSAEAGARGGGLEGVGAAALWLADEDPESQRDEDAGKCRHVEGHAPAEVLAER